MLKRIFIFFLIIYTICNPVYSQQHTFGTDTVSAQKEHKNLQISLLTCGTGNETWQTFGHCAIRIIDNTKDSLHKDLTYNYGTVGLFDGSIQNQFLKGKMRVYLDVTPFSQFISEYKQEGRCVDEIVLLLDEVQKEKMQAFMDNNDLPENRYYSYDFLYDNCTIRVRDVFSKTLGAGFIFGQVIPKKAYMTFYDAYKPCFGRQYWFRIFGNIFFGCKKDIPVNNHSIMFLPEYLEKAVEGATFNGKKISGEKVLLLKNNVAEIPAVDGPFIFTFLVALLTISGLLFKRLKILGIVMGNFVLVLSGLIGVAILFAWFGSGYDLCSNNYNILWALPTNIILPFLPQRINKMKYAFIAMCLIGVSLIVHITRTQEMLLFELMPFWLVLFFVYGIIYRNKGQI